MASSSSPISPNTSDPHVDAEETSLGTTSFDVSSSGTTTDSYYVDSKETPRYLNKEFILCVSLHLFLILFHIALLVVWATGTERTWQFFNTSIKGLKITTESTLNAGLQGFYLILSAVMLSVTQTLAIRRQISKEQTLTALADKTTAWQGLGSSMIVLWQNIKKPAALLSAMAIYGYFATLTALQTTTPILFTLSLDNITQESNMDFITGTPALFDTSRLPLNWIVVEDTISMDWTSTSSVLNVLSGANQSVSHPGLTGNRIYDTLITTSAVNGSAQVTYTDFHVNCGMVPDAELMWLPTPGLAAGPFTTMDGEYTYVPTSFSISATSNGTPFQIVDRVAYQLDTTDPSSNFWARSNVLVRIPTGNSTLKYDQMGIGRPGRNLLLYTVFDENSVKHGPIFDSNGGSGSTFTTMVNGTHPLSVQVIGCSISSTNGTKILDIVTNQLVSDSGEQPPQLPNRFWQNWDAVPNSGNQLEDYWAAILMPQSLLTEWPVGGRGSYSVDLTCTQEDSYWGTCHQPTTVEQILTDNVFGAAAYSETEIIEKSPPSRPAYMDATLAKLEGVMSNTTAMLMWGAARMGKLRLSMDIELDGQLSSGSSRAFPERVQKLVTKRRLGNQLRLNILPLAIGAAASVFLFVLALAILCLPWDQGKDMRSLYVKKSEAPDTMGLLETILLTEDSNLKKLAPLANFEKSALRVAGDFKVRFESGKLVALDDSKGDDYDSLGNIF